ncbi:MAG: AAA family ATPase [Leptospiraceae bacterium]|nr:AAA family ATPase [Leptospiraceae bacterium]MCP5495775.1 AAA family ATPase [Leptospiraceae bacterium]
MRRKINKKNYGFKKNDTNCGFFLFFNELSFTKNHLTDLSSAFNIATHLTLDEEYNSLFGFTETEIKEMLSNVLMECNLFERKEELLSTMKFYYDGYVFSNEIKVNQKFHTHNPFFKDMSDFYIHPISLVFIGFERIVVSLVEPV